MYAEAMATKQTTNAEPMRNDADDAEPCRRATSQIPLQDKAERRLEEERRWVREDGQAGTAFLDPKSCQK